jgi:hypothetical protein
MAVTHINLRDGVTDGARHVTELVLRPIGLADITFSFFLDMGKLPDAMKMISRLSGEPLETLTWMTQDDVLTVLLRLSEHMDKFNKKAGF